jgi:hypothetical protein
MRRLCSFEMDEDSRWILHWDEPGGEDGVDGLGGGDEGEDAHVGAAEPWMRTEA